MKDSFIIIIIIIIITNKIKLVSNNVRAFPPKLLFSDISDMMGPGRRILHGFIIPSHNEVIERVRVGCVPQMQCHDNS